MLVLCFGVTIIGGVTGILEGDWTETSFTKTYMGRKSGREDMTHCIPGIKPLSGWSFSSQLWELD